MQRALDLAQQSKGFQSPNPMVGAVISMNNKIIGEGFHKQFGKNHAEINALQSIPKNILLKQATISVSLEPCFHFGKTPPCVNAILANPFSTVNISLKDLNPLTAGQSIKKLRAHQITVNEDILADKGRDLVRHFLTNIKKKRPYILLKYATSQDGFIGVQGEQVWLSNPFSKRLVHLWRSKFDAILVGANTARTDNPQLSTRYFSKRNPLRVILTKSGNLSENLHIFDNNAPTLVATTNHKLFFPQSNTDIIKLNPSQNYLLELMEALLAQKNIGSIIIEGGAQTLQAFIDANLWDEARVFKTSKNLINGIPAPTLNHQLLVKQYQLDTDKVLVYHNKIC